ncbi:MAG: type IV secretion system protein [Campylobacter sp.]|nr:type IV secretion system protein [Campylobacter sp.]
MEYSDIGSSLGKTVYTVVIKTNVYIQNFFTENQNLDTFQNLISGTGKVIAAYLTLWIMIEGYKILWGGSNKNIQSFYYDALLKFIFIAFALFATEWISLVAGSLEAIKSYAISAFGDKGGSLWENIALWGAYCGDFMDTIIKQDWFIKKTYTAMPIVLGILSFIGFVLAAVPLLRVLIVNVLAFMLLMIFAPVAFYFLIFGVTKSAFAKCLEILIANILMRVFVYIFSSLIISFVFEVLGKEKQFLLYMYHIPFLSVFYGILVSIITNMAVDLAKSLSSASIDGISRTSFGASMGFSGAATNTVYDRKILKTLQILQRQRT